jgi:uridylate kinase
MMLKHAVDVCPLPFFKAKAHAFAFFNHILRGLETGCDAILAAKQGVNGVHTGDPKQMDRTKMSRELNDNDAVRNNLKVMDQSALILVRDYVLPVHMFNFDEAGIIKRICTSKHTVDHYSS